MEKNVVILTGPMIANLTTSMVKIADEIEQTRKTFSECKIVLEENYVEEFVTALTKLFAQINSLERQE